MPPVPRGTPGQEKPAERCTGVAWEVATSLNFKLNSLYYTGEWDLLRATVLTELKDANERGDRYQAAVLRTSFGELAWLVADQLDTAVWPDPASTDRFADPVPLATSFAEDYLAMRLYRGTRAPKQIGPGRTRPFRI